MESALNSKAAIDVVTAALQSGVIKLRGASSATSTEAAEQLAHIDAAYLLMLFDRLTGQKAAQSSTFGTPS